MKQLRDVSDPHSLKQVLRKKVGRAYRLHYTRYGHDLEHRSVEPAGSFYVI